MSKIYVQNFPQLLSFSGSLVAAGSISGSLPCAGYSQLVGYITSSGSSETGSGLCVQQSVDGGVTWDINSGCLAGTPAFTSSCMIDIIGNAVKVRFAAGANDLTAVRTLFQLKPVAGTAKMPDVDIDVISSGSVTVTSGSVTVTAGSINIVKSGSVLVWPQSPINITSKIPLITACTATITACQFSNAASIVLTGTQSGEFLTSTFLYSASGATANIKTPGGYVYFFSGCPAVTAGCTTLAASDYSNIFGRIPLGITDWDSDSACYAAAVVHDKPIPFPSSSKVWCAFKLTTAACFNDATEDEELLDMILTYRRDS